MECGGQPEKLQPPPMGVAAAEAEPVRMPEADLWPCAKAVYLYTSIQMSTIVRQTGQ